MIRLPHPRATWLIALVCLGTVPLVVIVVLLFGPDPRTAEAGLPLVARDADYVGASTCRSCHPNQFSIGE